MYRPLKTPKRISRNPGCTVLINDSLNNLVSLLRAATGQVCRTFTWAFSPYSQLRIWDICTISDFDHYNTTDILFVFSFSFLLLIYSQGYCQFKCLDDKYLYLVYIKQYYPYCFYVLITYKSITFITLLNLSTLPYMVKKIFPFPECTMDFTASHGFGHWQDQAILEE